MRGADGKILKNFHEYPKDKQQTILINGEIKLNSNNEALNEPQLQFDRKYICPFCLEMGILQQQFKKVKQFYQCNFCTNLVKGETLLKIIEFTPEQYATWVFNYRLSGFFQKVKNGKSTFERWANQLKSFQGEFSFRFWKRYNELKGEYEQQYEEKED